MKRKLLSIILAMTLVGSLAACGWPSSSTSETAATTASENALNVWCWAPAFNMNAMEQESKENQKENQEHLSEKIRGAIEQVGTEDGFLYILDLNTLWYKSPESIDVNPLLKKKLGVN